MENAIRKALQEKQFKMFYQPKIDIKTGQLVGAEALIRWQHPERGFISPAEFIPIAEETGLILQIGNWVITEVCKQINAWQKFKILVPRIALNVSSLQLARKTLINEIQNALKNENIEPKYLAVEITEGMVMNNPIDSIKILYMLKEMGISIAIDDFGTGYSSLGQLQKLPLDELKIDRVFINDIGKKKNTEAIIKAIIGMAHSLGLRVVAEGVETIEQLNFLEKYSCDEYQGYLFSPPIPADEFALILGAQSQSTKLGSAYQASSPIADKGLAGSVW